MVAEGRGEGLTRQRSCAYVCIVHAKGPGSRPGLMAWETESPGVKMDTAHCPSPRGGRNRKSGMDLTKVHGTHPVAA